MCIRSGFFSKDAYKALSFSRHLMLCLDWFEDQSISTECALIDFVAHVQNFIFVRCQQTHIWLSAWLQRRNGNHSPDHFYRKTVEVLATVRTAEHPLGRLTITAPPTCSRTVPVVWCNFHCLTYFNSVISNITFSLACDDKEIMQ